MSDFYLQVSSPFSNQHFVNFTLEDNSVIPDYVDNLTSRQLTSVDLDWDFSNTSQVEVNTSDTSSFTYVHNNFDRRDSNNQIEIKGGDWEFSLSSDGKTVDVEHHNLKKHEVQKIVKQIDSDGDGILEPSDLNNLSFSYHTGDEDNSSLYDIKVNVVTN
jgi:hypothetical protein